MLWVGILCSLVKKFRTEADVFKYFPQITIGVFYYMNLFVKIHVIFYSMHLFGVGNVRLCPTPCLC